MMKYRISAFLLFITVSFFLTTAAQDIDSVNFINAAWQTEKVACKSKLVKHHFDEKNLFGANQNISYVIVKRRVFAPRFHMAAANKKLRTTADFAESHRARAAINGNFFDVKNGGAVDYTRVNGTVVNENRLPAADKPAFHQKAAVVISKGRLSIKKGNGSSTWEQELPQKNIMLNGPLLFLNNQFEKLDSGSFNITRHPRTCVGIKPNGDVIMLVADGRNENAAGMNIFELAKIMRWLGCESAINFDGGGSSTLFVKKKGVINYPSDNKKWDHEGQRRVANILYIK